jgi:hypothetical protein
MGVSSTTNTEIYTGDNTTVSFSFPFYFFRTVDLFVYVYNLTTGAISAKTQGVDYTVVATPDVNGLYHSGGSILFGAAPTNAQAVVISRFPIEQQNLTSSGGTLASASIIQQFDYVTLLIQSLQDQINRCAALPAGFDTALFNPTLPSAIALAANQGCVMIINALGNGFDIGPAANTITGAATYAAAAA